MRVSDFVWKFVAPGVREKKGMAETRECEESLLMARVTEAMRHALSAPIPFLAKGPLKGEQNATERPQRHGRESPLVRDTSS